MEKENEKKRICGIIGNPLDHSLSPIMHNTAFSNLKLPYKYHVFEIKEDQLAATLDTLKFKDFKGVNITHPFKLRVIDFLDFLDNNAKDIGSVNTIINNSGRLTGYNTDSSGALVALKKSGLDLIDAQKKILILGAGGAARAAAIPLAKMENEIIIANRTYSKGEELAHSVSKFGKGRVIKSDDIPNVIGNIDLLINATSVGMKGESQGMPISEDLIGPDLTVFDMVYNPKETPLLIAAKEKGAKVVYGHEMFLSQGALAFELWTKVKAPLDVMRKVVLKELDG
jgi:shikimate dehydrogenase